MEMLLGQINELLMINGTSSNNNHIFTEIVGLMEIYDHVTLDLINIIDVTEDRLAHHMLPVDVVVNVFHKGLHMIVVSCLKFLPDSIFFQFKVVVIVVGVAQHIAHYFY